MLGTIARHRLTCHHCSAVGSDTRRSCFRACSAHARTTVHTTSRSGSRQIFPVRIADLRRPRDPPGGPVPPELVHRPEATAQRSRSQNARSASARSSSCAVATVLLPSRRPARSCAPPSHPSQTSGKRSRHCADVRCRHPRRSRHRSCPWAIQSRRPMQGGHHEPGPRVRRRDRARIRRRMDRRVSRSTQLGRHRRPSDRTRGRHGGDRLRRRPAGRVFAEARRRRDARAVLKQIPLYRPG